MHNVSSSIPGKTRATAAFILSRLFRLNLLKTEVEMKPNAGIRMIYNAIIIKGLSTIKK